MTRAHSRRRFLRVASAGAATGLAGCLGGSPEEKARRHREALSKYTDVERAVRDGYQMSPPYVRTDRGTLGLPLVNLSTSDLEPEQPSTLFYNLRDDGSFALLGVGWLVPAESVDSAPSMFGKQFFGPTADESAFIPRHYGLHAWLFDENSDELFARYHADVSPPSYIEELETVWDALEPYYTNREKATQNGYTNTEKCVATSDGGYGVSIINTDNTGTKPGEPAVLIYRLSSNWSYRLLGAEWYVPADSTDSPPSMFGRQFEGPMDGHSSESDQPSHYGLHAWLFSANPRGMFARYNPLVRC